MLMPLPYPRHVSDDLSTWYQDPLSSVAWAEAHDILKPRLGSPHFAVEDRFRRDLRLLNTSFRRLGRVEPLTFKQAADDLARLPERESSPLRRLINAYPPGVDVVSGPRITTRSVKPVMDALRLHLETSEALDRICALAAANNGSTSDTSSDQHGNEFPSSPQHSA